MFADVTSANVVGYSQSPDTIFNYNVMICPVFETVGEDQEFSLADLKVTGYTESTKNEKTGVWTGGCNANAFELKKLNQNGTVDQDQKYYYFDYKGGKEGAANYKDYTGDSAGWYTKDSTGTIFTKVDEKNVTFPNGQAFWTKAALNGQSLKLVSSGSVSRKEIAFPTIFNYNVAAGNGTPVDLTLADFYVTGYDASTKNEKTGVWTGGCNANAFELKKLNQNGTVDQDKKYYYFDYKGGKEGAANYKDYTGDSAGWYTKDSTGTIFTKVDAENVEIPAGQGFWIKSAISGKTLMLHVPAPELD